MAPQSTDLSALKAATPELEKRIRAELNESAAGREEDVRRVRDWLARQPHLPSVHVPDQLLLNFLRGCKFSLEACKRKMDMYFSMRAAAPEIFSGRDVDGDDFRDTLERGYHALLPRLNPDGLRVWLHLGRAERQAPRVRAVFAMLSMMYDALLHESTAPVAGDVYIVDGRLGTPSYLSQFTPRLVRTGATCLQEAYPVRVKQIHIVNPSPLLEPFLALARSVLNSKLLQRIHIHGSNLETLHKFVPAEMLPAELGGGAGPVQDMHDAWVETLRKRRDWFRQQEAVKADESLRPGKPRNYDEMFGSEGSFRKIDID